MVHEYKNIWEAAKTNNLEAVREFIKNGTEINLLDKLGNTPLMLAACKGHTEIATELLANKANTDLQDPDGFTALTWAAIEGHTEMVKILLAHNADINLQDKKHYSALICAVIKGHIEVVKILLAYNPNLNLEDKGGKTALIWAIAQGHTTIAKELLNAGSDLLFDSKNFSAEDTFFVKLLSKDSSCAIFKAIIDDYQELNSIAKIELLKVFHFMQDNYNIFKEVYSKAEIEQRKAPLKIDLCIIDALENINTVKNSITYESLNQLKKSLDKIDLEYTKYKNNKDILNLPAHKDNIQALHKGAKKLIDNKYNSFQEGFKDYWIENYVQKDVKESIEHKVEGLLGLPKELFAKIFLPVLVHNKSIKGNNASDNSSDKLLCATDILDDLSTIMGHVSTLEEILDSL